MPIAMRMTNFEFHQLQFKDSFKMGRPDLLILSLLGPAVLASLVISLADSIAVW